MTTSLLSPSVFHEAIERMIVGDPFMPDKIKWWLQFGAATERWFQFEYGFWLSKCLGDTFSVGCEQGRVDLKVFRRTPEMTNLWKGDAVAKIELKVHGNWFTKPKVFDDIRKDRKKAHKDDDKPIPSFALVVWFYAKPTASHQCYGWITDQVTKWKARGYSLDTSADIQRRMAHEFNGDFECCGPPVPVPKVADAFDQLEAHIFLFCNKAAKALWA
jgi:hypothetical protein